MAPTKKPIFQTDLYQATKNSHDTIEQAITTKNPGLAVLVDFEKAFDSVSFKFIQRTLEIFGFGENFCKWINILLGNTSNPNENGTPSSKKIAGVSVVNGYPTTQFKILRGCRQGDPIAGYLFVLCIEILALTIQNSKVIPYETVNGNKKLNDTYADDLTLFLKLFQNNDKKNKTNIKHALECFSLFSTWSGLNINKNKTYINIFGKDMPEPPYVKELSLNYCKKITLLGITYDSTLSCMISNFDEGLRKLEIVAND